MVYANFVRSGVDDLPVDLTRTSPIALEHALHLSHIGERIAVRLLVIPRSIVAMVSACLATRSLSSIIMFPQSVAHRSRHGGSLNAFRAAATVMSTSTP